VSAIATGDNKEQQGKKEVTVIVHSDTRVNPVNNVVIINIVVKSSVWENNIPSTSGSSTGAYQ